jgi:hypothetical protein
MVVILLAVLGILIGAGTLVSRTTQGQLGSLANSAAGLRQPRLLLDHYQRTAGRIWRPTAPGPGSTWSTTTRTTSSATIGCGG